MIYNKMIFSSKNDIKFCNIYIGKFMQIYSNQILHLFFQKNMINEIININYIY